MILSIKANSIYSDDRERTEDKRLPILQGELREPDMERIHGAIRRRGRNSPQDSRRPCRRRMEIRDPVPQRMGRRLRQPCQLVVVQHGRRDVSLGGISAAY